jgi:hypothetical protein
MTSGVGFTPAIDDPDKTFPADDFSAPVHNHALFIRPLAICADIFLGRDVWLPLR